MNELDEKEKENNIRKINVLLDNTQISTVSSYCYGYSDNAHASAIYWGMITFIKEFVRLGYTEEMLSDWVDSMNKNG